MKTLSRYRLVKRILIFVGALSFCMIAINTILIKTCPTSIDIMSAQYPGAPIKYVKEKLKRWHAEQYCPWIPFSVFEQRAYAQPFLTDLENLKSHSPQLTESYVKIDLINAWNVIRSADVVLYPVAVAVFDTGVDASGLRHPEFRGVHLGSSSPIDRIDHAAEGGRGFGHGTAVAGIIGANNLSLDSVLPESSPQMNGVLSGVTRDYTIESRYVTSFLTTSKFARVVDELPQGTIVNISSKVEPGFSRREGLRKLYSQIIGGNEDKLFVIAAGNDNKDASSNILTQTGEDNVVVVGSTNNDDIRWVSDSSIGSNFGDSVALSAPGKDIYIPAKRGKGNYPANGDEVFNYLYPDGTGTSVAAPLVAGVAGLLKALNGELTTKQIKDILTQTADPIFALGGSQESEKLLGLSCSTALVDVPIGSVVRGCRLNALRAVCASGVDIGCESEEPPSMEPISPKIISNDDRPFSSSVAIGDDNSVNVAWLFRPTTNTWNIRFARSDDGGETFTVSPPLLQNGEIDPPNFPPLIKVAASRDQIHLLWLPTNSLTGVRYSRSVDQGSSFLEPILLSDLSSSVRFPRIAASGSVVAAMWFESSGFKLRVSVDGGETFGPIRHIGFAGMSRLDVDISGGINVFSSTAGENRVEFVLSTDGGATFTLPTSIPSTLPTSADIAVSDIDGSINVVWSADGLKYSRSEDRGLSFTAPISIGQGEFPYVAAGLSGVTAIFRGTGGSFMVHSIDNGATFSEPILLPGVSLTVEGGVVTDGFGRRHTVWSSGGIGYTRF